MTEGSGGHIILPGGSPANPVDSSPLVIQTRVGNTVPCQSGWPLTEHDIRRWRGLVGEALRQKMLRVGVDVIERQPPSAQYNCHGMTTAYRRARAYSEAIKLVLEDDDYALVPKDRTLPGDLVVYFSASPPTRPADIVPGSIEHSGIVVWCDSQEQPLCPWVLSKWGEGPEYLHRYHHCLYDCSHVSFYREGHR